MENIKYYLYKKTLYLVSEFRLWILWWSKRLQKAKFKQTV